MNTLNYQALGQFEEVSTTLAYIYREMVNNADDVNRDIQKLTKIGEMNTTEFSNGQGVFYSTSTARTATDFERSLARYELAERLFVVACNEHDIDNEFMVSLIVQSRGEKK